MNRWLSRLGARLGNWNDTRFGQADAREDRQFIWRALDRFAGSLYVRGDR